MPKVHHINLLSFAKFQAFFAALLGLLAGVLYAGLGALIDVLVTADLLSADVFATAGLGYGTLMAFAAILGMPVLFAVVGFLLGLLQAAIYKVYVKCAKAIEINFWQ